MYSWRLRGAERVLRLLRETRGTRVRDDLTFSRNDDDIYIIQGFSASGTLNQERLLT